jgi:hypothetical protein
VGLELAWPITDDRFGHLMPERIRALASRWSEIGPPLLLDIENHSRTLCHGDLRLDHIFSTMTMPRRSRWLTGHLLRHPAAWVTSATSRVKVSRLPIAARTRKNSRSFTLTHCSRTVSRTLPLTTSGSFTAGRYFFSQLPLSGGRGRPRQRSYGVPRDVPTRTLNVCDSRPRRRRGRALNPVSPTATLKARIVLELYRFTIPRFVPHTNATPPDKISFESGLARHRGTIPTDCIHLIIPRSWVRSHRPYFVIRFVADVTLGFIYVEVRSRHNRRTTRTTRSVR